MSIKKGTRSWASVASSVANYQTELDALLDAIETSSPAKWTKRVAATVYDTDYVYGMIEHVDGAQLVLCTGIGNDPIDASNLGESSQLDDRIYVAYCPERSSGFGSVNNPRDVDWCDDSGATLFYLLTSTGDINGAAREFNWRFEEDDGWFLLEYEHTVGTPDGFVACSGSGVSSLLRARMSDYSLTGDGILVWRGSNCAADDTVYGEFADSSGDRVSTIQVGVDTTSLSATYNPSQPWIFGEASVVLRRRGVVGAIDRGFFGWIQKNAVSALGALESGAYEHLIDGLVWIDPA